MTKKEFTKILTDVRDRLLRSNSTPWDINNGACDEFADTVVEIVKYMYPGERIDGVNMQEYDPDLCHTTVLWKGKFYDAECLSGVRSWRGLPIVANKGLTRSQALRYGKKR